MTNHAIRLAAPLLAVLLAAVAALAGAAPAEANWRQVREQTMTLRESGRPAEAYTHVTSARPANAAELADQQFLAGFIALRSLARADVALTHFQGMAVATQSVRASERDQMRAMAGYWLGRALDAAGRQTEAKSMYEAASQYRSTFYGLMAASQAGLADNATRLSAYAPRFPTPDLAWHDPRVKRELILAIIKAESSFRQEAVSPAGARGLMQVMPDTAVRVGRSAGVAVDLNMMARNGHYNVAVGSKFIADLLEGYNGNVVLAASAYNAGPGRAQEWLRRFGDPRGGAIDPVDWIETIPFRETREYVKRVIAYYVTYIAIAEAR